jgi:uncharacterized membrane protein
MSGVFKFVRTTVAGGVLFLIPLVVLTWILGRAVGVADRVVEPIAHQLPPQSLLGLGLPRVMAVVLLIGAGFLAGLAARTAWARKATRTLESTVLVNVPGYEFFKGIGEGLLGVDDADDGEVVLARFDDGFQLGFVQDRLASGLVAVFLPDAPNPYAGTLLYMTPDRLTPTGMTMGEALKCFKRLGHGSAALLA